jgi:ribonuclease G
MTTATYKKITIVTNPYLAAYLTQGLPSMRTKWYLKYKKWINIKSDIKYGMLAYSFFDINNEPIDMEIP